MFPNYKSRVRLLKMHSQTFKESRALPAKIGARKVHASKTKRKAERRGITEMDCTSGQEGWKRNVKDRN